MSPNHHRCHEPIFDTCGEDCYCSITCMAKCYLTLLCIDNLHLFLHCHVATFVPASASKMDKLGHLSPQIHIESHSNVNLFHLFYFKVYLWYTKSFRKKSDWFQVSCLFLGHNNRLHIPVCTKMNSSGVRKVLSIVKVHMSLDTLQSTVAHAALVADVWLVTIF